MLQGEHSAILLTFIKLPFSIKSFVLSIFKWPLKTGFTVQVDMKTNKCHTFSILLKVVKFVFELCIRKHIKILFV